MAERAVRDALAATGPGLGRVRAGVKAYVWAMTANAGLVRIFLQENKGPELARLVADFIAQTGGRGGVSGDSGVSGDRGLGGYRGQFHRPGYDPGARRA